MNPDVFVALLMIGLCLSSLLVGCMGAARGWW